jgi:hypothetical protein
VHRPERRCWLGKTAFLPAHDHQAGGGYGEPWASVPSRAPASSATSARFKTNGREGEHLRS